ncbi:MAG: hypothetical protein J6O50_15040 [Ruminiclostridium sp.]|nr:hypothetical protein [Ruminiclostridium sp.]
MINVEITVTDVPKCIKSFAFSPRIILSEKTTVEYLIRMKEYIFGNSCCKSAEKIGISVFDLVFIGERSFSECCSLYLNKIRDKDRDIIRTALLLKKMYNGEYVRISGIMCDNDKAYVREPEYVYLSILNDDAKKRNREINLRKKVNYNKKARIMLESVRLAAVKYGMYNTIQYKELIDKYNFRRFSTNLKLNNRPASLDEINAVFSAQKERCLADLSDPKTRISMSALFAIAYGGFKLSDLYEKNTVFDITSFDKEKKLCDLSGDLINIIYNGNGVEIANMYIHIITVFSQTEIPPVDMKDLGTVMDNYSMYYAAASLASVCESIFKNNGLNGELKQYMKKHTIENYWTSMDRLLLMKQYSVVVTFCYKLAHFDPVLYREDPEYQGEILYAFERAEKFAKELKKSE